jgi:class 3 adenylate cyclase/tetratricopeptide (TPR) repeat protein
MAAPRTSGPRPGRPRADAYAGFFPHDLHRRLLAEAARSDEPAVALPSAGLCLDIAGFTMVTDRLESGRGDAGIEELIKILNRCFTEVIDEATTFGGEVATVTGDGLVILWPCSGPDPAAELITAGRCALAILDRTRGAGALDENRFAVKISIGAGQVFVAALDSDAGPGQLLMVAGPLIADLFASCGTAERGQVAITPLAGGLLPREFRVRALPPGGLSLDGVAGTDASPAAAKPEPPGPPVQASMRPPAMPTLIDSQQLDWLAELRAATVMFVGFEGLSCADAASFDLVRRAAARLDRLVRAYSGLQEKIQIDDKGPLSLITFGLPPRIGSYHPDQALAAAMAVRRALRELGIKARIGVATGKILRGPVGSETRRDFTIYGTTVHRAVRLMAHASDRIFCDEETREASIRGYRFRRREPLPLKGVSASAVVFELMGEEERSPQAGPTRLVIGRQNELSRLGGKLLDLRHGRPTISALVGAAGIGKSSVLRTAIQQARELGIEVLYGSGTPLTVGAPYAGWRHIFLDLFGNRSEDPQALQRARILEFLADDPGALALAPLIDAVAPVGLPESELVRPMGERARALATREFLTRLVARKARRAPTLLVFDDGHWLDDASMQLLVDLWQEATGAAILVATRPDEEGALLLSRLAGLQTFEQMPITGLALGEVKTLLATALEVERPSNELAEWIYRATSGHPLFTSELAKVLRERGVLRRHGTVADFAIDRREIDALTLPGSIEALVTDRLDRLGPVEQLTFKIASAIGVDFSFSLLQAIYPHEASRPELRISLERLIRAGLIVADVEKTDDGGEQLSFAHAIFRQAGYDLMPRTQRRAFHLAIARVLEPAAAADPLRNHQLLAFHYRLAGQYEKALHYLDLASASALQEGAFGVAADLVQQALDIFDRPEAAVVKSRLLPRDWKVRLARCHSYLGDLNEGRRLGCEVLAGLGYSWPEGAGAAVVKGIGAILRQIRRAYGTSRAPSAERLRELDTAAEAATTVMLSYYYHASAPHLLLATLLAIDFASEAREHVKATDSYGILSLTAGLFRLTAIRRHLLQRHERNAALCGTPDDRRFYFLYSRMHHTAFCDWEQVEEDARRAVAAAADFADPYWANIELTLNAVVAYYRGRFGLTRSLFEELRRRAESQHSRQHQAWANYGAAEALVPMGLLDEAIPLLLTAREQLHEQNDNHSRLICLGLLAVARLRRGETSLALAAATELSVLVRSTPPNNFSSLEGYASAAEVWLGLAQARPGERRRCHREAARALRFLARYAMLYPVGRPRLWLYRGYLHWQRGSRRKARRCWMRALDRAERNRMPYEIARAATALATKAPPSAALAERWTALAEAAFRQTGASRILSPMEREEDARGGA